MKKTTLNIIKHTYVAVLFASFLVYYYRVQEDGQIDIGKYKYDLLLFGFLFLIGAILAAIDIASLRDKGSNISKKAVYVGVSLAIFLVVWRLAVYFI
ncbi:hypothetical protein [Bacillus infantis]|uniref:Uncharacterized protein n=1 Tax=Bacillus infantis TaxID=324767 RepID=A0A5D4QUA7_9BACI|nr:hypothetical protein [Bacillus infantis]TYS41038.1 hypothetical protein FZD51_24620 [Bacillus infantis]